MEILKGYPPNYEDIKKRFNPPFNAVFAYGDILYVPDGRPIPEYLFEHEKVHQVQQGDNPKFWWDRYIADDEFRLSQEIEAYRRQYSFAVSKIKDRNSLARFLDMCAKDLSSKMYGNIISYKEAIKINSK